MPSKSAVLSGVVGGMVLGAVIPGPEDLLYFWLQEWIFAEKATLALWQFWLLNLTNYYVIPAVGTLTLFLIVTYLDVEFRSKVIIVTGVLSASAVLGVILMSLYSVPLWRFT